MKEEVNERTERRLVVRRVHAASCRTPVKSVSVGQGTQSVDRRGLGLIGSARRGEAEAVAGALRPEPHLRMLPVLHALCWAQPPDDSGGHFR